MPRDSQREWTKHMLYDLSQPIFNNVPQWPRFKPTSVTTPHMTAVGSATVERIELMTHTGTHVDAPYHFFSDAEAVDQLSLRHFHAPCIVLDLRDKAAASGITEKVLALLSPQLSAGVIVLLKTGWGDKRALTKEFLTEWPYLTGDGARYLVSAGIHGVGIEDLSIGGFDDPQKEKEAHQVLLRAKNLIIEDIHIPEASLDGKLRHFAAFPILISGASVAWARTVAWDQGELE